MTRAEAPALRVFLCAALAVIAAWAGAPAEADVRPLTLFQRVGRSPWVFFGQVKSSDKRFVSVSVVEVLKGSYAQPGLRVIYKLENFLRKSYEDRIEFHAGERGVFFLKRYETDRPDGRLEDWMKADDLFASSFGAQGRFVLPEEGGGAYVEAIREFVRASGLADPPAEEAAILGFLDSPNPHIQQAGLEQTIERRLAGPAQTELLLRLSESPREPVRLDALQILGQVAEDLRASGGRLEDQADIVNRLKAKVIGDGGDLFRAEAVKVVAALGGADERAFLERLAKDDASQLVRYEAGRALSAMGSR
ncbi:MAG: HEAT repeat domain-containing protein [Acidobacteria bacterium]|nr:HEAT repeat domain-containing protein [Acidobacteriota bacterium]